MYKQFIFEGDIHDSLDCVPLSVRRKLDLALLKISLAGWQALSRKVRLELCHLPVESEHQISFYRDFMRNSCREAGVPLKALEDPNALSRTWNDPAVPVAVALRTRDLGVTLSDHVWRSFDEETRYALLKLAEPKRNPLKLRALFVELGLVPGVMPTIRAQTPVCDSSGNQDGPPI